MGYFKETLRGLGWMTALRGVIRGLAIVKVAILARILIPSQFGTYGIALLVLGLLEMLTETGINVFLIQEKDALEEYLDSSWAVSILRGIIISLAILALIPFVVWFFGSPQVTNLLYLIAGVGFIRGFINPMSVKFQKSLEFKKEFSFQSVLCDPHTVVYPRIFHGPAHDAPILYGMLVAAVLE